MLNGEVVGQLSDVTVWNLGQHAAFGATNLASFLSQFSFLDSSLETVFVIRVRTRQHSRVLKMRLAAWALQL